MKPRAAWIRQERAAHTCALGAPQCFPLTGDGMATREVREQLWLHGAGDAAARMAEARYRDWLIEETRAKERWDALEE